MRRFATLAAAATAVLAACGGGFDPPSRLADLRVLALVADPLEAGPGDRVAVLATVFVPDGKAVTELEWSFCPFTTGARGAFACAVPACETPLVPDPATGAVEAEPVALAQACLELLAAAGTVPVGVPATLPAELEAVFRLRVATGDGQQREAVERFRVLPGGVTEARNRPPVVAGVDVEGAVASVMLRARIEAASLDAYVDASGLARIEDPVVSWYVTAGDLDYDRTSGVASSNGWSPADLDPGATGARLWVVARDLRGGVSVAGPFALSVGN